MHRYLSPLKGHQRVKIMTEEIPQINERNASDRLETVITAIERGSEEPMHDPKYFKW